MNIFQKLIVKALGLSSSSFSSYFGSPGYNYPADSGNVYISRGYKELPNLYSIISIIIQKSSIVPFEIFKVASMEKHRRYKAMLKVARTPKEIAQLQRLKEETFEKVEGTDLEKILIKPNETQSIEQIFEELDGYKLLTGNAYLWGWSPGVGVNATKPTELHVPPSPYVEINIGDDKMLKYSIQNVSENFTSEDIAHFKNWNPITSNQLVADSLYGMSPLMSCRRLMQKYMDADISQGAMFKNMSPAGILTGGKEGTVTEDQAISVKDRYKQLYGGVAKAGEVIVTSAAMTWQQIGFSPVDLNVLEGKEEILSELCNVYHVPIGLFSSVNSTENNMIESRKILITDAVIPLVEARKQVLNMWLAPKYGDDLIIEFDYSVFSEIGEELSKLVEAALKMWWITPNEKREMTKFDRSDDPLMEKIYVPGGLSPIEELDVTPDDIGIAEEEELAIQKLLAQTKN